MYLPLPPSSAVGRLWTSLPASREDQQLDPWMCLLTLINTIINIHYLVYPPYVCTVLVPCPDPMHRSCGYNLILRYSHMCMYSIPSIRMYSIPSICIPLQQYTTSYPYFHVISGHTPPPTTPLPLLPSIHLQVHPFSVFKSLKVCSHLCILLGAGIQQLEPLHKLDALVVTAAHKCLFCHL